MSDYLDPDPRVIWEHGPSESDDRTLDPARPRTLSTLRRLAAMKGYAEPKPDITEAEAKLAISHLARLKAGPDGKAERQPAVADCETPHFTLTNWRTARP